MMTHTLTRRTVLAVLGTFLAGCANSTSTDPTAPAIHINEFMAQNDIALADPAGTGGYPDWIELYNAGASNVDLGGMYLTDDLTNPTKWRVPDGAVIPADGFLIFWADNDERQGNTHTNFKLATAGDQIGLFNTAVNNYAAIDTVEFGQQTPDVSYGRFPDGSSNWKTMTTPTPGQPNE